MCVDEICIVRGATHGGTRIVTPPDPYFHQTGQAHIGRIGKERPYSSPVGAPNQP
jgi:hypothetical protein